MGAHLLCYQCALSVLVWRLSLLLDAWPSAHARLPPPAGPSTPRRQRANAPKPFAGLPQKPPWALCAHEALQPTAPPPVPPAPMPPTPPHGSSLQALLSPYGLALSRLARAGQPAGQRPSPWRSRETRPRHRVPRRLSRASWHALSWPAGGSGADCARAGGPGRRPAPAGPRAGL